MSRKFLNTIMLSALALAAVSCDFEEINIDPNNSTEVRPGHLLTYTQLNTSVDGHTKNMQIGTCMTLVQQAASTMTTEFGAGDKYYMMGAAATQYYLDFYSTAIKNWREMEYLCKDNAEFVKQYGVTKIWGAYLFQRMTDLYGDVPYSEAGLGFREHNFMPKYDTQESIYKDMIKQVKEGIQLLGQEGGAIEGDLFYDGDVEQWKKFGNSLLLHLGMRLCKVDPALAEATAKEAIAGGIMAGAADAAIIMHSADRDYNKNQVAFRFSKDNPIQNNNIKISKTFVDYLKATNDPRIKVFCSLNDGNVTPALQQGQPNGYDKDGLKNVPGFPGLEKCSTINTRYIIQNEAPTIIMTASETKLLEAEAILRGWVAGDAADVFNEAIRISMAEQTRFYGRFVDKNLPNDFITSAEVEAFLAQNLFANAPDTEKKMEVLGCQYWVTTFMNGYESYANWRRCGYPELTPTNYPGNLTNGSIPRRITYASDEYSINGANLQAAIQHQGEDKVTTRIWWDAK